MRLFLRSAALVVAALLLFAAGMAYAAPGKILEAYFLPGVKFVHNGDRQAVGDAQGMYADGQNRYPNHLVYNGNVYVPLRFFEEVGNKYTFWHADSKTVFIWDRHKPQPEPEKVPPKTPISGSANIKIYALKGDKDRVTLSGVVNTGGNASISYLVKEPWGKTIRSGSLLGKAGETWTPFNMVLTRQDFGNNDRLQVTINRSSRDGKAEALQMSVYRSALR